MGYFFEHNDKEDYLMETCFSCGMKFAFSKEDYEIFRRTHSEFFCPRGHSQYYSGQTKEEKLKERVQTLEKVCQARLNTINYVEKQFYGMKGYAAKLKKQIKKETE